MKGHRKDMISEIGESEAFPGPIFLETYYIVLKKSWWFPKGIAS